MSGPNQTLTCGVLQKVKFFPSCSPVNILQVCIHKKVQQKIPQPALHILTPAPRLIYFQQMFFS